MPFNSTEILEERATVVARTREIANKTEVTAEDRAELDKLNTRFDQLTADATLAGKIEGYDALEQRSAPPAAGSLEQRAATGAQAKHDRQAEMRKFLQRTTLGEEGRSLAAFQASQVEQRDLAQSLGTIQTSFAPEIQQILDAVSAIRSLSKVISTDDGTPLNIVVEGTPPAAAYTGEGTAYTNNDPTISTVALNAYKVDNMSKLSEELVLNSHYDIVGEVNQLVGRGVGLKAAALFAQGNGTNQAKGVFAAGYVTAGLTTGTAGTITWQELANFVGTLPAQYANDKAAWVMHPSTIAYCRTMTTGTGGFPVFSPATGGADSLDRILGFPVRADSNVPAFGSGNMVTVFGDYSRGYTIRQAGGLRLRTLLERYADTGQVGILGNEYIDGRVTDFGALRSLTVHA